MDEWCWILSDFSRGLDVHGGGFPWGRHGVVERAGRRKKFSRASSTRPFMFRIVSESLSSWSF